MDERPIPAGERPRAVPEIIPPDGDDRQSRSSAARIRVFVDGGGIRHIYFARLGPLGILVLALMIGILFAIMLVLVLGAFLIWIPLVGLLVAAAIISGLLRAYFRQPLRRRKVVQRVARRRADVRSSSESSCKNCQKAPSRISRPWVGGRPGFDTLTVIIFPPASDIENLLQPPDLSGIDLWVANS